MGRTLGEKVTGKMAEQTANDMRALASQETQFVFHSQGTVIGKNALASLAQQGDVEFNSNTIFVFLAPVVDREIQMI